MIYIKDLCHFSEWASEKNIHLRRINYKNCHSGLQHLSNIVFLWYSFCQSGLQ